MSFRLLGKTLFAGSALLSCTAFGHEIFQTSAGACTQVNSKIAEAAARDRLDEARRILAEAIGSDGNRLGRPCAGLLSTAIAALFQASGKPDEARIFAEQAIAYYQSSLPAQDPAYLHPLHVLAAAAVQQNRIQRAEEVLEKMQLIPATKADDRALYEHMSAIVLQREGKKQEAESHYRAALADLSELTPRDYLKEAAVHGQLASLYLEEGRDAEAAQTVNDALRQLDTAHDILPLFRMNLLEVRAVVWMREARWHEAEADLAQAVSLSRGHAEIATAALQTVVTNYAYVLRKLHRKEARSVEKWAAALRASNMAQSQTVDVAELVAHRK